MQKSWKLSDSQKETRITRSFRIRIIRAGKKEEIIVSALIYIFISFSISSYSGPICKL